MLPSTDRTPDDRLGAIPTPARTAALTLVTAVTGAALMTLAAKIQIPFWPVPMTLHTLAVLAFAVALGPRLAVAIVVAYLGAGAAGIPVFSGSPERGIGLAYMVGPTGGFLAGCLAASWVTGSLAAGRGTLGRLGAMLAGLAALYALGLAWLAVYVPAERIVAVGLLPFLPGEILKVALISAVGGLPVTAVLARVLRR